MAKENIPQKGDEGYWDFMKKAGVKALKASAAGRPKKIASPEKLWEYACDYFQEVDSRPFLRQDFIRGGDKAGDKVHLENIQPYSWAGLDEYLIKHEIISGLDDYRLNTYGNYTEFQSVVARIAKTMFNQKFRGAAVGAFNSSIIARDLQLAEITKSEVNAKVTTNDIDYSKLSPEALEEIAKQSSLNANKD